ncbi:MAG: hypothetical protein IT233_07800 [Bacteroidia bacterium]|nr:hypothetical protein [Bacteroidia bacterium]
MIENKKQENIEVGGSDNKVVGGDDNSKHTTHNYVLSSKGKLGNLFKKLTEKYENNDTINQISEDLKRYTDGRDTIGLEEKLKQANKSHLFDDFSWLKQEFYKKLVKYQNYEPAQEIFAFILAIVLERYRNYIRPKIANNESEEQILNCLSSEVIQPILKLIHDEGCDDIMQLSATEIEGMFHYLTGNCHIKWSS